MTIRRSMMHMNHTRRPFLTALYTCGAVLLLSACSTTHYRESADKEVYNILAEKSPGVPGMVDDVNIDVVPAPDLSALATINEQYEFLGPEVNEVGASLVSLEKALDLAFTQSREYKSRKEQLYLTALALTLDRHQFAPIFTGEVSATHIWDSTEVTDTIAAVDTMAGPAAVLLQQYADAVDSSGVMTRGVGLGSDTIRITEGEATVSLGFDKLLRSGGRIATDITTGFFEFLGGGGGDSAITAITGTFVQPLLRGAGRNVTMEFLTQSERDVLYELRDFTNFRKDFAVRVASQYYTVLRARDATKNNYAGLLAFNLNLEREQAFQEEGLRTASDVARLRESQLQRELSWTNSARAYTQALDNFKIQLGLPVDTRIVLDQAELESLLQKGVKLPAVSPEEATQVALVTRLDLYTQNDIVDDADRRIKVAANALKAQLDLVLTGRVNSQGDNRFASIDFDRSRWTAGAVLELPLDQKAERNAYRRSLIDYELAVRNASLAEDNVKLDVRNSYRSLLQAQKDFEISQIQVDLNERRVEEEKLRAELGLGDIIDLVDAQNSLTSAQTGVTGAIVDYQISLLEFWRDLGILYVKENGMWEEISDV